MHASDASAPLPKFTGIAPLFPLPETTIFPNVMVPLHIFEPRYRVMVQDSLKSDNYIAIASLKDGWQSSYEHKDCAIHNVVCLGSIVAEERLEDGRYCLLVQGICRANVVREITTQLPYRVGQLQLIQDVYPLDPVIDRDRRQQELVRYFREIFVDLNLDDAMIASLQSGVPLGELCDVIAHAMRLTPELALPLLEQVDVDQRSDLLLELLKLQCRKTPLGATRTYPPTFSLN